MPLQLVALVILGPSLTSCGGVVTKPITGSAEQIWAQRQTQLSNINHWQLRGRIGFVTQQDSGSASLYWQQSGDTYEIKVIAPFGQGSLLIVGDQQGVILKTSDTELKFAKDVELLVWQQTGLTIPVNDLIDWIRGLPGPDVGDEIVIDDLGRIQNFASKSWQVNYRSYQKVKDLDLPKKMQIKHNEITIKLAIKHWQIDKS